MAIGATDALSSLGGDLTFSVSWSVASELLDAAKEAQLGEAELIAIVLGLSIVLSALPTGVAFAHSEALKLWRAVARTHPLGDARPAAPSSGIISFLGLFVSIFKRISVSIVVQLLSANVRAKQPLRLVRVLALLTVAVFFLFLEATATVGRVRVRTE